ncbi:MAG TPA: radical SAM protein [Myxococcales bacterium]|jgi:wyosine [tRNA(Phe)-imidazoG37] synthetase (radical SAM superfamily)
MASTPLFTQHSRLWRDHRYVYPVISRRSRGLSIGINLSPGKQCTFRCVYCSVDRTVPGEAGPVDLEAIARELDALLGQVQTGELWTDGPLAATPPELRRLNDVAFSGDGEPTAAAEFPRAAEIVVQALGKRSLAPKIVVITNATLLNKPEVVRTLAFLDGHGLEVWAKLDAGTEEHYRQMDRSCVPLDRILANLLATARLRPVVIQSMFVRLHGVPPAPSEIDAWLGRLKDLMAGGARIDRVQVYTSARKTAEPFVQPLTGAELEGIAARVREIGLRADTFG